MSLCAIWSFSLTCAYCKGKSSPYSVTERAAPELIPVLGSQPAGDVNHKPGGRLPLLFARPAVTPATLEGCYQFWCLVNRGTMGVNSLPKTVTRQRRGCDLNPGPSATETNTSTTRLPSHQLTVRRFFCDDEDKRRINGSIDSNYEAEKLDGPQMSRPIGWTYRADPCRSRDEGVRRGVKGTAVRLYRIGGTGPRYRVSGNELPHK